MDKFVESVVIVESVGFVWNMVSAESVVFVKSVICIEGLMSVESVIFVENVVFVSSVMFAKSVVSMENTVYIKNATPRIYFCTTVTYSTAIDVIYSVCVPTTTLVETPASTTGAGVVKASASDDDVGAGPASSPPTVTYCVAMAVS